MKKKRVAMYSQPYKYVVLMVIVVFSVNTYDVFQDNESNLFLKLLFPIVGILASVVVYYFSIRFVKNNPPVLFNNTTIFVNKTSIPFRNVVSLKTTSTHINNRHRLKITYHSNNEIENSFSFYPRIIHLNLREFTKLILKHNPKAKVQKQFIGPFKFDKF